MAFRIRALAMVTVGFLAAGTIPQSRAQNPPPLLPVPQVTPQFNDPGPQLTIPPPGNPVQQLSPTLGAGSPAYSAPQIYSVPEESPRVVARHSRHHSARHRHVSRSHAGSGRSGESRPRER